MIDNSKLRISIVNQSIKIAFINGEEVDSIKMKAFLIYHNNSYNVTCFIKKTVANLSGGCNVGDRLSVDGFLTMNAEKSQTTIYGEEYVRDIFSNFILNITDVKSKITANQIRAVPFHYASILTH